MRFGMHLGPFWVSTSGRRRNSGRRKRSVTYSHPGCNINHRSRAAAEQCGLTLLKKDERTKTAERGRAEALAEVKALTAEVAALRAAQASTPAEPQPLLTLVFRTDDDDPEGAVTLLVKDEKGGTTTNLGQYRDRSEAKAAADAVIEALDATFPSVEAAVAAAQQAAEQWPH